MEFKALFPVFHRPVDGDGVVNVLSLVEPKAVAVVEALDLVAISLGGKPQHLAMRLHVLGEVLVQFVLRVTEHRGVGVVERDVHKRGERREHGKLRELRDARDHQETYLTGAILHLPVDWRESRADAFRDLNVLERLRHGIVVLVDEDDGGRSLVREFVDGSSKITRRGKGPVV